MRNLQYTLSSNLIEIRYLNVIQDNNYFSYFVIILEYYSRALETVKYYILYTQ